MRIRWSKTRLGVAAMVAVPWMWWYSTRSAIIVSMSRQDGTSERRTLRRLDDLPAAIGTEAFTAVPAHRPRRERQVALEGLVLQVGTEEDDHELVSVLRLIGEAGAPGTLAPFLHALQKRKAPMSPRAMVAAEQAVAKIRERHRLPDAGTLTITDGADAGHLAVAHEAGTLALPERPNKS